MKTAIKRKLGRVASKFGFACRVRPASRPEDSWHALLTAPFKIHTGLTIGNFSELTARFIIKQS